MSSVLYQLIPSVDFPSAGNGGRGIYSKSYYSFVWPDRTPCIPVEMFLLYRSSRVKISTSDGGTVGNDASQLSHLVRYCYNNKIDFWDLRGSDFDELILILSEEISGNGSRARNNDTIKTIISTCVLFLKWLQEHITTDKNIVGVDTSTTRYQIKLAEARFTDRRGKVAAREQFLDGLPNSISYPKEKISNNLIKSLWDAIAETQKKAACSNKLKGKFSVNQQRDHIDYMRKRREVQLSLLEATGLRPQELTSIRASINIDHLDNSKILLPTLKRRKEEDRLIPLDRSIAIKVQMFILNDREKLIKRLLSSQVITNPDEIDDCIYLNAESGKMVKPDAAYQDFRRLAVTAEIEERACQSMFRHRFITNMVKLHLISFMDKNPLKTRHLITSDDYRTILHKVTKFTGHGSPDSLLSYIDLAWEDLGAFSFAYDIKELHDRLSSIYQAIKALKSDVSNKRQSKRRDLIGYLENELDVISEMALILK